MKNKLTILAFIMVCFVLVPLVGCGFANSSIPGASDISVNSSSAMQTDSINSFEESTENTQPSSEATQVPSTGATEPVVTHPIETLPGNELIGTKYTRDQLNALDSTRHGYGPGILVKGKRPQYVVDFQRKYSGYDVLFISSDQRNAYLTFNCTDDVYTIDDYGNQVTTTTYILDTLADQRVKAVFFVTLRYCMEHPDTIRRIIDDGHHLGNYGSTERELPGLSVDEIAGEIATLHEYVKTQFGYTMKYLRPYKAIFSEQVIAVANSLGYTVIQYSYSYDDGDPNNQPVASLSLQRFKDSLHKGVILRFHSNSTTTVKIVRHIVNFLRDEQYKVNHFP